MNRFSSLAFIVLASTAPADDITQWSTVTAEPVESSEDLLAVGKRLYGLHCIRCHGQQGRGDGAFARELKNRPRDFGKGLFKARSTQPKGFPSDLDFFRTITAGFPAYDMPSFRSLPEDHRWALVHYTKSLIASAMESVFVDVAKSNEEEIVLADIRDTVQSRMRPGKQIKIPAEPAGNREASVRRGKMLFIKGDYNCANCHGHAGKGDGPNANNMKDEWGFKVRPRDITLGRKHRKLVHSPEDMVRVILTGIQGTPMPSFDWAGTFPEGVKEIWDIARYVESISTE